MNRFLKALDFLFLTRPILFFPGWATLLAGYTVVAGDHQFISRLRERTFHPTYWNHDILLALLSFAAAMGCCFVLNQLQDVASDKNNNKLFLLGDGHVSRLSGYVESLLLLFFSLAIAIRLNGRFLIAVIFFLVITGFMYNFKPFVLKDKPVGGLAANMLMGWIAFSLGWLLLLPFSVALVTSSLPYLFFNTALYFLTTLPDFEGDRASGKVSFPVRYGFATTVIFSLVFYLAAATAGLLMKNEFMLLVCLASLPFMARLAVQRTTAAAVVAVKAGIAVFALLICLKFPLFLLLMAILFFMTKFYYKHRFQYDYPNFRGR
jgi:4-hydroxybenzoate polyprenyltransferase